MRKQTWIYLSTLIAFLFLGSLDLSAQRNNRNYDYNDDVVVVTNYGDRHYDNRDRRRNNDRDRIRNDRRWKASILDRAYAIAKADGRICKRERRELRRLEQDLGIQYKGRKRRRH